MTSVETPVTNVNETNIDNSKKITNSPESDCNSNSAKSVDAKHENQTDFKAEASPFFPPATADASAASAHPKQEEIDQVNRSNLALQRELDKVITIAKQQHQYINNLQKANMNLKAEAKQLKDEKTKRDNYKFTDRSNLHQDSSQAYDLVHIGRIEDHNRAEKSFNRNSSSGKFIDQSDFPIDQKENFCIDDNNQNYNNEDPFCDINNTTNYDKKTSFVDNRGDDHHQHRPQQQNFSSSNRGKGINGGVRNGNNRQRGNGRDRGAHQQFDGLANANHQSNNRNGGRNDRNNGGGNNPSRGRGNGNGNGRNNQQRKGTDYNYERNDGCMDNFMMPGDRHQQNNRQRNNNNNGRGGQQSRGRGRTNNRGGRGDRGDRGGDHNRNQPTECFFDQPFHMNETDQNDPFSEPRKENNNQDRRNQAPNGGSRGRGRGHQGRNNDMRKARANYNSDPFSCVDLNEDGNREPTVTFSNENDVFDPSSEPQQTISEAEEHKNEQLQQKQQEFFAEEKNELFVIKNSNDFSNVHTFFEEEDVEEVELMGDDQEAFNYGEDGQDCQDQNDENDPADAFDVEKEQQDDIQEENDQDNSNNCFYENDPVIIWSNQRDDDEEQTAQVEEINENPDSAIQEDQQDQVDDAQSEECPQNKSKSSIEEQQRKDLLSDFGFETSQAENEDASNLFMDDVQKDDQQEVDSESVDFDWLFSEIEKAAKKCDELSLQALLDKAYSYGDQFPYDLSEAECTLASLIDLTDQNNVQAQDLD